MEAKDLEVFNAMPFFFWVKDEEGRYLWGNKTICEAAGENVAGKTDDELPWANNADTLRADDKRVFESGDPLFIHELAENSADQTIDLSVCKFIGNFEGKRCAFGVSFVVP